MNSIIYSIKRFIKNRNTVTIIGVVLVLGILYFGYNSQIKKAVNPISVPVAKVTIGEGEEITSDKIEYVLVSPYILNNLSIYQRGDLGTILSLYSKHNVVIPQGSFFFKDALVRKEELPGSAISEIGEGEVPFKLPVDINTTFGNSIQDGDYIDIYMRANDSGKVIVGKLIRNVKVLGVKDATGNAVFEANVENRTPSYLIFGVNPEINMLLLRALYMGGYSVELFPIPHGTNYENATPETQVSSTTLEAFINERSIAVEETFDEIKPVISNVAVNDKTLTITATDNIGVKSYYVSSSSNIPTLSDTKWQTSNTYVVTDYGTYYVFVRDAMGNVASTTVEVTAAS